MAVLALCSQGMGLEVKVEALEKVGRGADIFKTGVVAQIFLGFRFQGLEFRV